MRALVVDASAPSRIAIREVAEPVPAPGDALIEVRAVSLNRGEVRALRTAVDGTRPGWDVAGTLLSDVDGGPRAGARVVGIRAGQTWAERVTVPAVSLAVLPAGVSFAEAAVLPTAGLTAIRILRLGPAILGRRVLVNGASGGVGRFAVQLAHLGGAQVTALVRGESSRSSGLREIGADHVAASLDDLEGRFDLILDSVGGPGLGRLMTMVHPSGTLVMFGNTSDEPTTFNVRDIYNDALVRFQGFELFYGGEPFGRDLEILAGFVASGRLDPQLADELPWEDIGSALDRMNSRDIPGKLALMVGASA